MQRDQLIVKGSQLTSERFTCHAAAMAKARILKAPVELSGCGTLMDISLRLRDHVCATLVAFVQCEDPLKNDRSSWVWLRADGTIVVELCDSREGERQYVDSIRDIMVGIFPAKSYATPDSRFYARILDPRGDFFGSVATRWRGFPPVWERLPKRRGRQRSAVELLSGERISFRPFRLEPLSVEDAVARIQYNEHQAALRDRITGWLLDGCPAILEPQDFSHLRQVCQANDPTLVAATGGAEKFRTLMLKKAAEHLQRCLKPNAPRV